MKTRTRYIVMSLAWGMLLLLVVTFFIRVGQHAWAEGACQQCKRNLWDIEVAKGEYALTYGAEADDVFSAAQLNEFLDGRFFSMTCPSGGSYSQGTVVKDITCNMTGHYLCMCETPWKHPVSARDMGMRLFPACRHDAESIGLYVVGLCLFSWLIGSRSGASYPGANNPLDSTSEGPPESQ